mgnify:CR=1 FL=1
MAIRLSALKQPSSFNSISNDRKCNRVFQNAFYFFAACSCLFACAAAWAQPPEPTPTPDYAAVARMIPTEIEGTYKNGTLIKFEISGRGAYLVQPKGPVDPQRRWIITAPFWLSIKDGNGRFHHEYYDEIFLSKGFHLAGINVGTSCGSPTAAELYQKFYEKMVKEYNLNPRVRLIAQSNGGLISYAWAFRNPKCVDRIFGICPVTDFTTWPPGGLAQVISAPDPGLGFNMTVQELQERVKEFNPIDNLKPLAEAGVKIFHIHGDLDTLVPMDRNSEELLKRYKEFGGQAELEVLKGLGHGGTILYENKRAVEFLTE